jgi:hypothetical protein
MRDRSHWPAESPSPAAGPAAALLAFLGSLQPAQNMLRRQARAPATAPTFESSDWSSSPSAIVAVANQPKICCAHHSAIGIAAFPIGRVQHASSQMSFPLFNHTQHSSDRNIGRHMLRATYGDQTQARRGRLLARRRPAPRPRGVAAGRFAIPGSSCELAFPFAKSTCQAAAFVTTPAGRSRKRVEFAGPSTPSRHDHVLRRH